MKHKIRLKNNQFLPTVIIKDSSTNSQQSVGTNARATRERKGKGNMCESNYVLIMVPVDLLFATVDLLCDSTSASLNADFP